MKALALHLATRRLALRTLPEPEGLAPSQVRVRVERVGLCPLDRALLQGKAGSAPAGRHDLIPGHEMVGRVVQRGEHVRRFRLGDYVVATVRQGCPLCVHCQQMAPDRCYTGLYRERGIREEDGFLQEVLVLEEADLVPLPDPLAPIGVLVEPLSRVAKGLEEARRVQACLAPRCGHAPHRWDGPAWGECKRALVLGEEALALLSAGALRLAGARVTLAGRQPPESPLARLAGAMGADYLPLDAVPPYEVPEWVGRVDLVVDAQARPLPLADTLRVLDRNGVMVLMEGHREMARAPTSQGPLLQAMAEQGLRVVGCSGSARRHFEEAVRWLEALASQLPPLAEALAVQTYPLAEFRRAFQALGSGALKVTVVL